MFEAELKRKVLEKTHGHETLTIDEVMDLVSFLAAECEVKTKEAQLAILRERNTNLEQRIMDLELELGLVNK